MSDTAKRQSYWLIAIFLIMVSGLTLALTLSPTVQKGVDWLQAQIQTDGALRNEAQSVATPLQNKTEVLRTLQLLASSSPTALVKSVSDDSEMNTEYLARRALSLSAAGQNVSTLLETLSLNQNPEGGFGAITGVQSNALDSAWALAALSQLNQGQSASATRVRQFLLTQLDSDGGIKAVSPEARIQASALTLLALTMTTPDLSVSNAQQQIANWLAKQQGADGAWLADHYLTAYAIAALAPFNSDQVLRDNAQVFLQQGQNAEGAWKNDPFITAVVLRVLGSASDTVKPTTANVTGRLIDTGGIALSGVSISTNQKNSTSDTAGQFTLTGLDAGNYTLTIRKNGYGDLSKAITLVRGQTLDLGVIQLNADVKYTILRGQISSGEPAQPLKGALVTVTAGAMHTATTDANGQYEISGLTPGNLNILISASGLQSMAANATGVAGQVLIFSPKLFALGDAVPKTGQLYGVIKSASTGQALAGVSLTSTGKTLAQTDANGQFNLELSPGTYSIEALLTGFSTASFNLNLPAGSKVNAGTIQLQIKQAATRVFGVVKQASDGKPLANANVEVIGGVNTTTNLNGQFELKNLEGKHFDIRVSASGYMTQTWGVDVSEPTDIQKEFNLDADTGSATVLMSDLQVNASSVPANTELLVRTKIENTGANAINGVMSLQVLDTAGKVVGTGVGYQADGTTPLGFTLIEAGKPLDIAFRWNSAQLAPGSYTLVARASEAGSISQGNLLGRVLTTRQTTIQITSTSGFSGSVSANPPIAQANSKTPIQLSAVIQNAGNTPLSALEYKLQIRNKKTGEIVATRASQGNSLATAELLNLTFDEYVPTVAAEYTLEVVTNNTALGQINGAIYIGDAATAKFVVNKTAVLPGTHTLRGNITVKGMDVVNGSISDPLAPLIKSAVQKAVNYNNPVAASWLNTNRCIGCHVATQAYVGDVLTQKIATAPKLESRSIMNALITSQLADGSLYSSHPEFGRTQTMLGMWSLTANPDKKSVLRTLIPAAERLHATQQSAGYWSPDYTHGWFDNTNSMTSFNARSLAMMVQALSSSSIDDKIRYKQQAFSIPGLSGNFANFRNVVRTKTNDVYVLTANTLTLVKPDQSYQQVLTGLSDAYGLAIDDNGVVYVAGSSDITIRKTDGQVVKLSGSRGTDIALDEAGNAFVANYWTNTIQKIAPDGTITTHLAGNGLSNPYGLTFDQGELVIANYGGRNILKLKADKTVETLTSLPMAAPLYIKNLNGTLFVSTSNGLYQVDQNWIASPILVGQELRGFSIDANKDFLSGNSSTGLLVLKKSAVDEVAFLAQNADKLNKSLSWLLVDQNSDMNNNLQQAHRLMAFGEALKVTTDLSLKQQLVTTIERIGALLKTRQRADGGWGRTVSHASDSLATSQVGFALDYLNPSAKDPSVQKAIQLLLSRQQGNGSWVSENGILSTPFSATTWVSIWLPVALDRIGGIDTALTLKMPTNIEITNPSLAPTKVDVLNGETTHVWNLQGVTANSQNLDFVLTVKDIALNEKRAAANGAFLSFKNSFTGELVDSLIDIPTIVGSSFLSIATATDKSSYPANTSVYITNTIANPITTSNQAIVRTTIFDALNNIVEDLGASSQLNIEAGSSVQSLAQWNTGRFAAGNYIVKAVLTDLAGKEITTAQQSIIIEGGIAGTFASARISTDKAVYSSNDQVAVSSRALNLASNLTLENLTVVTRVINPDGTERWQKSESLPALLANQTKDYAYRLNLVAASVGEYRASLQVLNANGAVLAQQVSTFTVSASSSNGSGLTGTLSLDPSTVYSGGKLNFSYAVTNQGNSELNALPVKLRLVDPANNKVIAEWPSTITLAPTKNWIHVQDWAANVAADTNLVAVLSAQVAGKEQILAQATAKVIVPPIKLDVKAELDNDNRVLVWFSCGDTWWGSTSPLLNNQPCFINRKTQLQALLDPQAVPYKLVSSEADFLRELRSGRFNQYWLLGSIDHAKSTVLDEIREMVNRGNTIVMDSNALSLNNHDLIAIAGSRAHGTFNTKNQILDIKQGLFDAVKIPAKGISMCLSSGMSATVQATLPGGIVDGSKQCQVASSYPAILTNNYGKGQSILFNFDLLDTLQSGDLAWLKTFNKGQSALVNTLPMAYPFTDLVPAKLTVRNQGIGVTLAASSQWPNASPYLYSAPLASVTSAQATWTSLPLAEQQQQRMKLGFTAAAPIGQQTINNALSTLNPQGQTQTYGHYPVSYTVVNLETLLQKAGGEISSLQTNNEFEKTVLTNIRTGYNNAVKEARNGQYCPALLETVTTINDLLQLTVDTRSSRLALDDMLHNLMLLANQCPLPQRMQKAVITLKDDGQLTDSSLAVNSPYGGLLDKFPVLAGGTVKGINLNTQVSSNAYQNGQASILRGTQAIVQANQDVSADGDRFFLEYFGFTKAQIKQKAYRITGSQFASEAISGRLNGRRFVWVDGDINVSTPLANIGFSALNQSGIVLIVNGKFTLAAGMTMYGVLYGIGDANGQWQINSDAPIMINGLLAVEGNLNLNGAIHAVDQAAYYMDLMK